jgi:hypothetical protein
MFSSDFGSRLRYFSNEPGWKLIGRAALKNTEYPRCKKE